MNHQKLLCAALSSGADKAVIIPQSKVILSGEFRKICETNQCGNFAQCWMCPPFIGPIDMLMAQVRTYPHGLLYQTIHLIEDSYDIEGMFTAGAIHAQVGQRLQKAAKDSLDLPFLHLSCGGCHLCNTCAKQENAPCRHPESALSSMEGYGIDVYNTSQNTGLSYINGTNTVTYFGLILFSE